MYSVLEEPTSIGNRADFSAINKGAELKTTHFLPGRNTLKFVQDSPDNNLEPILAFNCARQFDKEEMGKTGYCDDAHMEFQHLNLRGLE